TLKDFLETVSAPTETGEGGTQPTLLDAMTDAIKAVRHRSYVEAAATLDKVKRDPFSDPDAPRSIAVRGLDFAYRGFYQALGPEYSSVWLGGTKFELPGYRGYQPTPDHILRLSDLSWLARRGYEYRLRIALLQAECFVGQRQFQDAIDAYETLAAEIVKAL